jgi:hypothetical protein
MARRQVQAEINSDPVEILPSRRTKVDDGAGGWRYAGPPTPIDKPLRVLIAPAKRRLSDMVVNTELGQVIDYPYIVLARHDADIERDDTFFWQGEEYQVKSIHIKTEVSKVAQVDYFGGNQNG